MKDPIGTRLKHAWNAFNGSGVRDPTNDEFAVLTGAATSSRPDRVRLRGSNARSIVTAIYNRIAIDCAAVPIKHVRIDQNGRYLNTIPSTLQDLLTLSPNADQVAPSFIQDAVLSMLDDGCVALVPVETSTDIEKASLAKAAEIVKAGGTKEDVARALKDSISMEVLELRAGKVTTWYASHVRVEVYNAIRGCRQEITLPKSSVAIVENPFYSVMNQPNSVAKRLIRKLNLLDKIDEENASSKFNMILQLPYSVRSDISKERAEQRTKEIEVQLTSSSYGIAYAGATERITQLNRPFENNMWAQITDLKNDLYNQLGMSEKIFNGTASEDERNNYYKSTIEVILKRIALGIEKAFLTKTARTQGQSVEIMRNYFEFIPMSELADIADKMIRNEILSANEFRAILGYIADKDPRSDELKNPNISDNKFNQSPSAEQSFLTESEVNPNAV